MPSAVRNTYRCHIEQNHDQRYEVRVEAHYAKPDWTLRVFFVAASPDRVLGRVAAALRFLQRDEDQLSVWGADPADRALRLEELLAGAGLQLDCRRDFPRITVTLAARAGEPLTPLFTAELKRKLQPRLTAVARPSRRVEALAHSA